MNTEDQGSTNDAAVAATPPVVDATATVLLPSPFMPREGCVDGWEYCYIVEGSALDPDALSVVGPDGKVWDVDGSDFDAARLLGNVGWEMVTHTPCTAADFATFWFKRKIAPAPITAP